jgi:hypothetical protein
MAAHPSQHTLHSTPFTAHPSQHTLHSTYLAIRLLVSMARHSPRLCVKLGRESATLLLNLVLRRLSHAPSGPNEPIRERGVCALLHLLHHPLRLFIHCVTSGVWCMVCGVW